MGAVTITNNAPALIEVASAEMLERYDTLAHKSATIVVANESDKVAAEALAKDLRALSAQITEHRKARTAILDTIKSEAIASEKEYTESLSNLWDSLTARIQAFIDAENARREAEAKAAREEQERLQKIENEKAEAEQKRLRELAELEAEPGEEPKEIPVTKAAPVYVPERYVPPPLKSAATSKKTTYSLKWIDATKVPINSPKGHVLRPCDDQAVIAYLKTLPKDQRLIEGAVELVEHTGVKAKG